MWSLLILCNLRLSLSTMEAVDVKQKKSNPKAPPQKNNQNFFFFGQLTFLPIDQDVFAIVSPPDNLRPWMTSGIAPESQVFALTNDQIGPVLALLDAGRNCRKKS